MEQNIIVNAPIKHIHQIAKDSLKGNWVKMCIAYTTFAIFTSLISALLDVPFSYTIPKEQFNEAITNLYGGLSEYLVAESDARVNFGGSFYDILVVPAFSLGLASVFLNFFRSHKVNTAMLFDGFSMWGKAFILNFLIAVKVFLWSMLFIVPGIVAMIRYSMSIFVLADHPEYRASQCLMESKRLMHGNKGKFALLCLSFVGWLFLSTIPAAVMSSTTDVVSYMSVFSNFAWDIPLFVALTYTYEAITAFYELATGHLVFITEEQAEKVPERLLNASFKVDEIIKRNSGKVEEDKKDNDQNNQ